MLSHKPIVSFVLMTDVSVLGASNFSMPVRHMISVTQFTSDVIFCVLLISRFYLLRADIFCLQKCMCIAQGSAYTCKALSMSHNFIILILSL